MQALLDRIYDGAYSDRAELTVVVYGSAKPAGSKRGFLRGGRVIVTDANPNAKPWKLQVAQVAGEAMAGRELIEGPLEVSFQFFRARPKGHYGKKGFSAAGRAMPYPTGRPDVLKLARGVEDALTGIVWGDDAQIVRELLAKEYGTPERVVIVVRSLAQP